MSGVLGDLVRQRREAAELTRYGLALLTSRSPGHIANVELGHCTPGPVLLDDIARALDVDGEELARWRSMLPPRKSPAPWTPLQRRNAEAACLRNVDPRRSRLTAARVELGITGAKLAKLADLPPSRISGLETGTESPLCRDGWTEHARAVAACLGFTCEELWPEHALDEPWSPPEAQRTQDDALDASELRAFVDALPESERLVLRMRFGLDDGEEHVLDDCAAALGRSRERARQIEARGIARLRVAYGISGANSGGWQ